MATHDADATRRELDAERASLADNSHVLGYSRIFFANPVDTFELACMASNIVDDFDEWGPMLQANEDGEYSPETSIERLRAARDKLFALYDERPRLPWPLYVAHVAAWHPVHRRDESGLVASQVESERTRFIAILERYAEQTIGLLNRYSEAQLEAKLAEQSGAVRESIWLLVLGRTAITLLIDGDDPVAIGEPASPSLGSGLIQRFKSAQSLAVACLGSASPQRLDRVIATPISARTMGARRCAEVVWTLISDAVHHAGQLAVHLGAAASVPPAE